MKGITRKISLFIVWLLAGIVVLLIIFGLLIQTPPVKDRLSRLAENQAAKVLNGDLTIGKISGNFFSEIVLEDVLWTYQEDTFVYINSVAASYRYGH